MAPKLSKEELLAYPIRSVSGLSAADKKRRLAAMNELEDLEQKKKTARINDMDVDPKDGQEVAMADIGAPACDVSSSGGAWS
jgi:hypothetical protein